MGVGEGGRISSSGSSQTFVNNVNIMETKKVRKTESPPVWRFVEWRWIAIMWPMAAITG